MRFLRRVSLSLSVQANADLRLEIDVADRGSASQSRMRLLMDARILWERWIALWNGELEAAEAIIDAEFVVHRQPPPRVPHDLHGRDALVAWIDQTRSLFDGWHLTVEVGPIVDGELVAGRWRADGAYRGGIPGATATPGTPIRFHGNDIWRAEDGRIREYWLSDDLLDLYQQLGLVAGG
jgi:predicted ester cyclase